VGVFITYFFRLTINIIAAKIINFWLFFYYILQKSYRCFETKNEDLYRCFGTKNEDLYRCFETKNEDLYRCFETKNEDL